MIQEKKVPVWIIVISAIFALMEIGAGLTLCFAPEVMLDDVDGSAKGISYLAAMWGTRQFALGVITAFAVYRASKPMLTVAYLFFLVMFAGDLFIGIRQNEFPVIAASIVMCIVSGTLIYFINKSKSRVDIKA